MRVHVNDEAVELDDRASVADLLTKLGIPGTGIAVAVDWAVVPRSEWHQTLSEGAKVNVVTAVQGG